MAAVQDLCDISKAPCISNATHAFQQVALSELPIAPGMAAQVKGYYWTQLMKRSDSEGEDASEHHLEALGDDRGLLALATREVAVNRIQQPGQELHRI